MPDGDSDRRRFRFGAFVLDVDRAAPRRAGVDLRLRPRSFEVLRHLVERSGRLVRRDTGRRGAPAAHAATPAERRREVRGPREAALAHDDADGVGAVLQAFARRIEPALQDPALRRRARRAGEHAHEVVDRHRRQRRESGRRDALAEVLFHVTFDHVQQPGRQRRQPVTVGGGSHRRVQRDQPASQQVERAFDEVELAGCRTPPTKYRCTWLTAAVFSSAPPPRDRQAGR